MQTLELPANGHAPFDAPFPINDPIAGDGPIAKERRQRRSVRFEKLLAEIERGENEQHSSGRPAFPLHTLPPTLRSWVEEVAAQTQAAPEAAAMLGLAASAAALAGGPMIAGLPGYIEPLSLYVGVLSGGDRCDALLAAAALPLRELEFEELNEAATQRAKDRVFLREHPRTLRERERRLAAAADDEGLEKIDRARAELEAFAITPPPRRFLEDVSARSLRYRLGQLGRIACFSASGEVFRQIAGRSSASRQRLVETLEKAYSAEPLVVEGPRGDAIPVACPHVTIASLLDRSLVSSIAGQRECHARSLLARFVFVAPESRVGRRAAPRVMRAEITAAYRESIRRLAARKSSLLALAPAAASRFSEWMDQIETRLAPGGGLAAIGDWGRRLAGTTLRIAGILHSWQSATDVVGDDTLTAAIEIARWLVPQAAHALQRLGAADDDCTDRERVLLRYARSTGATSGASGSASEFSPRDAWQHLRRTFVHASALRVAFAGLVHRGYLRVAREGERFPRRFALVELAVAMEAGAPAVKRADRRNKDDGHASNSAADTPRTTAMSENAESTQPAFGVAPCGGRTAG